MIKIIIHEPIWSTRSVGVARRKIVDDLEIIIDYLAKDEDLLFPDPFYITKDEALKFPTQMVKGVLLHIIPIDSLYQSMKSAINFQKSDKITEKVIRKIDESLQDS